MTGHGRHELTQAPRGPAPRRSLTVLSMALLDYRRGLVGWGLGAVLMILLIGGIYPSFSGIEGLDTLLDNYPEALLSLFGIEPDVDFTSAIGYLETEVFSFMVPLLLIGFGVAAGARLVAGDEERGTLGLTLARPVTRSALVLARGLALVVMCLSMGVLLLVLLLLCGAVFDLAVPFDQLLAATAAQTLLGLLFGMVAFTTGCATGRRGTAAAAGAGTAVLAYLWNGLTPLVDGLEDLTGLSPFEWATGEHPLRTGLDAPGLASLAAAAVVVLGIGLLAFHRRDVAG
jgi:ABC-2 type transport system permease protein